MFVCTPTKPRGLQRLHEPLKDVKCRIRMSLESHSHSVSVLKCNIRPGVSWPSSLLWGRRMPRRSGWWGWVMGIVVVGHHFAVWLRVCGVDRIRGIVGLNWIRIRAGHCHGCPPRGEWEAKTCVIIVFVLIASLR